MPKFPNFKFRGRSIVVPRHRYNTIGDLNDRDDLMLVTDTQDAREIKQMVPEANDPDYDSFFVKEKGGEFVEVWAFSGSVPHLYKSVVRVK